MPIRWKLIIGIGGPLVVLMTTLLVMDFFRLRDEAVAQTGERVMEVAERYANRFRGLFDTIAQVPKLGAALVSAHPDLTEAELYELLRHNVEQNPLVYGSCIAFEPGAFEVRAGGTMPDIPEAPRTKTRPNNRAFAPYVFRSATGLQRLDVADVYDYTDPAWEWYNAPRRTLSADWTEPFLDKDAGDVPMITFSAPLVRNGKFFGVITVDVELERLRRVIMDERPKATDFYIVTRTGQFLLASQSEWIMNKTVLEVAKEQRSEELERIGRAAMGGFRGTGTFTDVETGERMLVYFAPIADTRWSLGCMTPKNYLMGAQMSGLQVRVMTGAGIVAVVVGIVALIGSWIVRPVTRLAAAVHELGSGNLSATVKETGRRDEIGRLATGFNTMTAELRRHVAALTRETAARQAVESELSVARSIQTAMLPRRFPPFPEHTEFDLHAVSAPARQVGGDFFDFFFVDERRLTLVVADVSGKGVPAAMFMAVARTVVRDLAIGGALSPSEILNEANRVLLRENSESMFVTMFLGQYDTRTGAMRYANAGHPAAYVLNGSGKLRRCAESTGTVLGVLGGEIFSDGAADLKPGERLVFFTDGVTDARSESGEFFGQRRFEDWLVTLGAATARDVCERTIETLRAFQTGDAHDDITLLVLGRNN